MPRGIVVYYSRSGNTRHMGEVIAEAMNDAGLNTDCRSVEEVTPEELAGYDAIVIGSPCYYGQMAGQIKSLMDETVSIHGRLNGKVGGAFSCSANIGGGNETTIISILEAMLVSGMVVQGDPQGDHYGPVSVGKPDERVEQTCRRRGQRIAELTNKIAG